MNKLYKDKTTTPFTASALLWGYDQYAIQNLAWDDTEGETCRQIIVADLYEGGWTILEISELIDRSASTVTRDIATHEREIWDGNKDYFKGVKAYGEMRDKIARRGLDY